MLIYSGFVNHEVSPLGIYIYLSLYYDFFLSSFLHLCFSRNLAESQFSVALTVSARPRREQSNFGSAPRHQRLILRSDCFCFFFVPFRSSKVDRQRKVSRSETQRGRLATRRRRPGIRLRNAASPCFALCLVVLRAGTPLQWHCLLHSGKLIYRIQIFIRFYIIKYV